MLYIFELALYFYSTATKSSITEFEEIKSREFSADVVWLLHTGILCWFTMASCWKIIYQDLKKDKVGMRLFGAWKVIETLWLYEIDPISLKKITIYSSLNTDSPILINRMFTCEPNVYGLLFNFTGSKLLQEKAMQ